MTTPCDSLQARADGSAPDAHWHFSSLRRRITTCRAARCPAGGLLASGTYSVRSNPCTHDTKLCAELWDTSADLLKLPRQPSGAKGTASDAGKVH